MGARQKLNDISILACLIIGGVIGLVCESWLVSVIAAGGLLAISLHLGDIRPNRTDQNGPRPDGPTPPRRRPTRRR